MHRLKAKKRILTNYWILKKMINCSARILLVALTVLFNLLYKNLVIKVFYINFDFKNYY